MLRDPRSLTVAEREKIADLFESCCRFALDLRINADALCGVLTAFVKLLEEDPRLEFYVDPKNRSPLTANPSNEERSGKPN